MEKKIRKKIIAITIIVVLVVAGFVYLKNPLAIMTLEPEVRVTGNLYNYNNSNSLLGRPIWEEFNKEYGGRLPQRLIFKIIDNMKEQAEELGEDPDILQKCIDAAGFFEDPENIVPCYAEKAKFENYPNFRGKDVSYWNIWELSESEKGPREIDDCWILLINWGLGWEPLGHEKIIAVSTKDFSILYYTSCS